VGESEAEDQRDQQQIDEQEKAQQGRSFRHVLPLNPE